MELRDWSEELEAKFPATTRGYSMAKIAPLNGKPSRRSITGAKKKKKRRKRKKKQRTLKNEKPKDTGHFLVPKIKKFRFLCMPEQKCHKTRR